MSTLYGHVAIRVSMGTLLWASQHAVRARLGGAALALDGAGTCAPGVGAGDGGRHGEGEEREERVGDCGTRKMSF